MANESTVKRKVVFLDLRKKIKDEIVFTKRLSGFDEVISLTPYSTFVLEKLNIRFKRFSCLVDDADLHSEIIDKYKRVENSIHFKNLQHGSYILSELAKYISLDSFISALQKHISQFDAIYITDSQGKALFTVDTMLSVFVNFKSVIQVERDEKFYLVSLLRFIARRPLESVKKFIRFFLKDNQYTYDNKFLKDKYIKKKININVTNSSFSDAAYKGFLKESAKIISNPILRGMLKHDFCTPATKSVGTAYRPFIFLHGKQMFFRYESYKRNNIPVIMMQHGAYVNENYFLKHNEAIPADINLTFNDFSKALIEQQGGSNVHNVGSIFFDKKLKERACEYEFLYITYCSRYSYPGILNASEKSVLSATGENIFSRHKEVIELFGECYPSVKLCVKVKPGLFLGGQMYVPLKEMAKKYPNVSIDYVSDLFHLIEKSTYILGDYFSSEFSSKDILKKKNIILFGDILRFVNKDVEKDMAALLTVISSVRELDDLMPNISSRMIEKKATQSPKLVDYYSSSCSNTIERVSAIIDGFLK